MRADLKLVFWSLFLVYLHIINNKELPQLKEIEHFTNLH